MKFVLDTHIVIWYIEKTDLTSTQIGLIKQQILQGNVFVSAVSLWEIIILFNKGRIDLSLPLEEWLHTLVHNKEGLKIATTSTEIWIDSASLPNYPKRDPADRLIIATARHLDATLITRDDTILEYSTCGYVKAYDVKELVPA
jgi:PIN domain nuclease of toxin-antitoxin system